MFVCFVFLDPKPDLYPPRSRTIPVPVYHSNNETVIERVDVHPGHHGMTWVQCSLNHLAW